LRKFRDESKMRRWKKLIVETRGAEIAEAAAVLPLLCTLLLGIYWFGRAYNIYTTITHAAREGARAASAPTCATCTPANSVLSADLVADRIAQTLQASKLDPTQVTPMPASLCDCGNPTCGSATVSCQTLSGGRPNVCIQYNVQLDNPASGPATCGVSVSFRYPYQFYFPFTSLHMQKVWLKAQVQMKGEY
jgi:Flp pilus assembly protein TadG